MDYDLKSLIETDISFSKLSVRKGAAYAFSQYMIQDSIMLPPDKRPIFGVDNIYNSMKDSNPKDILSWEPKGGKVSSSSDLGYTWGFYTLKLSNGNIIEGKYLNVWIKQKDGSWKVEIDMGNSNQK